MSEERPSFESIDPATGRSSGSHVGLSSVEVESRLALAEECFRGWSETPIEERSRLLRAAGRRLLEGKEQYARDITAEMGKPIVHAEAEVEKCASVCDYYAEHAPRFLRAEPEATDARESFVCYEPLGPILAVMPWNFPYWQVFRFAAPALAAGNVALLKHASNVPRSALAIEAVFRDAGFPAGAFQTLLLPSAAIPSLIADPRVRAVTLTGSEGAGSQVAAAAGRAIKKTVLELGGSDPFVVLADADVRLAAEMGVKARTINSGQSCIAAKRFIVHAAVHDEFEALFAEGLKRLRVGDPMDRSTQVGPLARADLVEDLHRQVVRSTALGARLVVGGKRLEREGFFFEPTLLGGVQRGMPVWDEETFGPVAALALAHDDDEALRLANDTQYGLAASIWTRDLEKGKRLAAKVEAGCVFINGLVKSDPRLPFGGIKRSGYGRELGRQGLHEFVNTKTLWIG
ncbi:MAG TPA: NAD-dependent succinate-semialdehyde dehydrogenase [Planctomycetota bacterium]|nr:NAD-dependent succinate-semialdehyde dehydrogenase [Planctomycetota bacterium]